MKPIFNSFFALALALSIVACSSNVDDEYSSIDDDATVVTQTEAVDDGLLATPESLEEDLTDGTNETSVQAVERAKIMDADELMEEKLRELQVFYFDFDRSHVRDKYMKSLMAHARFLAKNPDLRVILHGHADERGTREYNMALGERRGLSASEILMRYGAARNQITTISHGEEKPASVGHDEHAWSLNRRVEIEYRK